MKLNAKFLFLALALVLGSVSCSQEYWEEQEAKKEAARQEKVSEYWSVVGKLVSAADRTDDYADKTFEPVIGKADPSDAQTRIVATNTLESARQRFANLIGEDVEKIGSSYTFKNDEIGTLVYSESGGNSLATVEVNIKQIPHLSKIRYATPAQMGDNGKFEGAAYYRFGDVISIQTKDGRTEYWVCVRPAFGKDGKENTHWITVSPVGKDNVLNYSSAKSSNKREYNIQDDLKYDTEHMQNLAELLFAICFPSQWHDNITDIPSMKMFHDMDKENIRFHNEAFWQNVQNYWEEFNVSEQVFGKPLSYFASSLQSDGLYLLYDESSWNTWFYNGPTVRQAHYTNTKGTTNANMHTAQYTKIQHDVINKKDPSQDLDYNVLKECTMARPYLEKPGFFGDSNPRWIVRYAEGCELSTTGKYGDNDIRSPIPGSTEVYRYYRDVNQTNDLANSKKFPEVSQPGNATHEHMDLSEFVGPPHYSMGEILKDQNNHRWFIVNQSGNPDEKSPYALAISFEGIQFSADKKTATNLPGRDLAIQAAFWLQWFFQQTANNKEGKDKWQQAWKTYGWSLFNVLENADFEPRIIFQRIHAQNGDKRQGSLTASIAYDDGTGSGKQRLLRWLVWNQNDANEFYWYLWDHYVTTPDKTTQKYAAEAYSNIPIYLEDIADQTKVTLYSPDTYAFQPLSNGDGMVVTNELVPRQGRTQTDQKGLDASTCVYNINTWNKRSFVTDMWLEPVLMFRVARIYDRGESDFDTLSEDGKLHFTRLAVHEWGDDPDDEDGYRYKYRNSDVAVQYMYAQSKYLTLDGKPFNLPYWKDIKVNK